MKTELRAIFDKKTKVNTFYGKAIVEVDGNVKTLYSYNTKVAEIDEENNFKVYNLINDEKKVFSNTTVRHMKEFFRQYKENREITKKELEKYLVK